MLAPFYFYFFSFSRGGGFTEQNKLNTLNLNKAFVESLGEMVEVNLIFITSEPRKKRNKKKEKVRKKKK